MGWNINTFNNKYQIKYGSNSSYLITSNDVSYLTITNDKHIGINNEFPSSDYLLDINGKTHFNSNIYVDGYSYFSSNIYIKENIYIDKNIYIKKNIITSNIIGGSYDNDSSNIIKLNKTSANNYSNNIVEIYGKTSLFGQVYINKDYNSKPPTNTDHLLVIDGSLKANRIYGDGTNINNLDAININSGIIPIIRGGTGLNSLNNNQILYGKTEFDSSGNPIYNITQSPKLLFDGTLLICEISAGAIINGILSVARGGTGKGSFNSGEILYGNNIIETSSNFKFENDTLKIVNLELVNSNIIVNDGVNAPRSLQASDIGLFKASAEKLGLIRINTEDFSIDSAGILSSITSENSTWVSRGTDPNISKIIFPTIAKMDNNNKSYVGINTSDPKYTLDVKGTINSSDRINSSNINSSNYSINGVDLEQYLNITFSSKDYSKGLIDNINLINNGIIKDGQSILVSGSSTNIYKSGERASIWKLQKNTPEIFESPEIYITKKSYVNILEIYNTDEPSNPSTYDIFSISSAIYPDKIDTPALVNLNKLFKFTSDGYLHIGNNLDTSSPPEKLTIEGNIGASGYIRSYYSDSRLKTLTSNITGALNIIDSLNGFYYVPNEKALQLGFEYDNEVGLSAQEVKKVIPEIVKMAPFDTSKTDENFVSKSGEHYLTICYERLGAIFVEAIKELRKENNSLKSEINVLKKDIDNIKKLIYIQ